MELRAQLKRLTKLNLGQGAMSWLTQLQILSKVQISGFKGLLNLLKLNFMILSIFSLAWFLRIKGVISIHKLLPWMLQDAASCQKTVFLKGMQCFLQDAMQGNTTKEIKSDGWFLMQDLGHRQNYSCQKGVQ
ncbi:hypothetical protein CK203_097757 [Vitis vinifera]|uniref:Uncharacterized protein n=1 Tax=Vitis vinifera TaxID=29760 RepID=A0A438BQF1_VITVI|nr:hypothetical protein CK203_097757 [Vitis vinifera]